MIVQKCNCAQKIHKVPIDTIEVGSGIIHKIPQLLRKYKKIYMVCDGNTYKACGQTVETVLNESKQLSHKLILPNGCLPDNNTVGNIVVHLNDVTADSDVFKFSPKPDFILGVGSGVINDCCRIASYRLGIPYGICGTAPSMDGYASAGSPLLADGIKRTVKCTTPRVIIADTSVMKDAPYDLLLAGLGDMFGKYTAMFDWELAKIKTGEYYCERIASDVLDATNKCLENGYSIQTRNESVVKNIIDGLLVSGLGMAFTNTSRPASGAEHIIAHVWETDSIANGNVPNLHGIGVCQGTLLQIIMLQKLCAETDDTVVKALIEKYMPCFNKVVEFCNATKYPVAVKDKGSIKDAIVRALTLRNRYTTIFYLNSIGKLEEYAEYAAETFVKWSNDL